VVKKGPKVGGSDAIIEILAEALQYQWGVVFTIQVEPVQARENPEARGIGRVGLTRKGGKLLTLDGIRKAFFGRRPSALACKRTTGPQKEPSVVASRGVVRGQCQVTRHEKDEKDEPQQRKNDIMPIQGAGPKNNKH